MNALQTMMTSVRNAGRSTTAATKKFVKDNSATICAGAAMAMIVKAVYDTYKASPEAHKALDEAREFKGSELTLVEKLVAVFPYIAKPQAEMIAAIILVGACEGINRSTILGLTAYANLSDKRLNEWKEKAERVLDDKQVQEIKHEIAKDHVTEKGIPIESTSSMGSKPTDPSKMWLYDEGTGQFTWSSLRDFDRAIDEIDTDLSVDGMVEYNELIWRIGEKCCDFSNMAYFKKDAPHQRLRDYVEKEFLEDKDSGIVVCHFTFNRSVIGFRRMA